MAYSKPNPIKQLQSQDQYKQDFEADLMEAGGETPLMQSKSKKTLRKENRKTNMEKRIADGSTEFEGGSDVGNFLRKNSYNEKKKSSNQGEGDGLTNYLKEAQAQQDEEGFDPDFNKMGSSAPPPPKEKKEKPQDVNEEDRGV